MRYIDYFIIRKRAYLFLSNNIQCVFKYFLKIEYSAYI